MDESSFKTLFKKSVKAQGGFSISLAAPMLAGCPDLYVAMPGFVPVLLEAKWLKECPDKFKRTPKFTELQKHYINNCNRVHPGFAHGLVGLKYQNKIHALICDPNIIITQDHLFGSGSTQISKQTEFFDVKALFELYVPKMIYNFQTKGLTEPIENVSVYASVCHEWSEENEAKTSGINS